MSWLNRVRNAIPFLPKRETTGESVAQMPGMRGDGLLQGI